jgi:selenium metabolism protein YedF
MKTIDARGLKCPMPLILTKRALLEIQQDENLEILIDNETSLANVSRFLKDHGMRMSNVQEGGVYRMTVRKAGDGSRELGVWSRELGVEEYCEVSKEEAGDYVVCVQKNIQGDGADEMGARLAQLFINTLPDLDRKPSAMVFLNSSVFFTLKDSPVLEPLRKLEEVGVQILVCGTCLDVFQKKDELAVGLVSNMYEILDRMVKASKVLYA